MPTGNDSCPRFELCPECRRKLDAVIDWAKRRVEREAPTTTPEDTLREAGISGRRQARYQRRMSSLLTGRA